MVLDTEGRKRLLLPIRVQDCKVTGLFKSIVYLDLVGLSEEQAKENLLTFFIDRNKPRSSPIFPDKSDQVGKLPIEFPGTESSTITYDLRGTKFGGGFARIVEGERDDHSQYFSPENRLNLVQKLNSLPSPLFEQLVYTLNAPPGVIPSSNAVQGNRVYALLAWAESPTGPGLSTINQTLELINNSREPLPSKISTTTDLQSADLSQNTESLLLQGLELNKRLLGNESPTVADGLSDLAGFYELQGRYGEAEPLLLEALDLRKRLLGDDHPDIADTLNNLASLYESQGRYKEAEPLYLQALELNRRLLGESHPSVATSLNNLAALYNSQGRYAEAEPLLVQALELRIHVLGESHPGIATSLNNLATLYRSQGRYSEAEPLLLQALKLREQLLDEEHPDVAFSLNNLAGIYSAQGRYSEAEPLFIHALEISQKTLGIHHPLSIALQQNLEAVRGD